MLQAFSQHRMLPEIELGKRKGNSHFNLDNPGAAGRRLQLLVLMVAGHVTLRRS